MSNQNPYGNIPNGNDPQLPSNSDPYPANANSQFDASYQGTGAHTAGYQGMSNQGYEQFPNGAAPMGLEKNKLAPWALGVSILALVLSISVIGVLFGGFAGVVALILGIIALVKAKNYSREGARKGMAITAIVLSVISLAVVIAIFAIGTLFLNEYGDCMEYTNQSDIEQCFNEKLQNSAS